MGSIVSAAQARGLPLTIHVVGTAPLDRVEIVRDLAVWRTVRPAEDSPVMLNTALERDGSGPAMFYVRVFQQDGQRAWTSPIWLE
jgi:hypothetical protein